MLAWVWPLAPGGRVMHRTKGFFLVVVFNCNVSLAERKAPFSSLRAVKEKTNAKRKTKTKPTKNTKKKWTANGHGQIGKIARWCE